MEMEWEPWFQEAWKAREEQVFPRLFGPSTGGLYRLDARVFEGFGQAAPDPRWLSHGVLKFAPTPARPTWIYATSGLSAAWNDDVPNPEGWSGHACEMVLETTQDGRWAVTLLQRVLAFQILLTWNFVDGKSPLSAGDRIPLRHPIDGAQSLLTWCLITPPHGYQAGFKLPSGRARLLHITGITEAEAQFARQNGDEELLRLITPAGYPVTDPTRMSVV